MSAETDLACQFLSRLYHARALVEAGDPLELVADELELPFSGLSGIPARCEGILVRLAELAREEQPRRFLLRQLLDEIELATIDLRRAHETSRAHDPNTLDA